METVTGRIVVGEDDRKHLTRAAKWAKFIAIVYFVYCGLMLVTGLSVIFAAGALREMMAMSNPGVALLPTAFWTTYGIIIILATVLMFFITLYLYRFAVKTLAAIHQDDDALMTGAFDYLGRFFRIIGIVLLVSLSILALFLIVLLIAFAAGIS
ncbi:MAG: DUF5362 family protein [Alistipes sp.]|jgi:hypothetical protein|nr:DUF5362 family protein [Alistipes sp.]